MSYKDSLIGKVPSSWEIKTVEELVSEGVLEKPMDGNHGSIHPKGDDFLEEGIPFIMASDLKGNYVDINNCNFISKEQAESLRKGFSIEGDILLSHKATIGRTAIVKDLKTDFIMLTPQVTYYRVKNEKKLNNHYLMYYFRSYGFQSLFNSWANSGSTRAYLGITAQRKLPILIPPIEEQEKIVEMINPIEEKLEVNNVIIDKSMEISKLLYKQWFIDFEFPTGEENTFKSNGGKMVNSEQGLIPEGWHFKPLEEVTKAIISKRGKSPEWDEFGEIPVISAKIIKNNRLVNYDDLKYVNKSFYEEWMKEKLNKKDFILTSEGPLGELYYIAEEANLCLGQRVFGIRADDEIIVPSILFFQFMSSVVQSELQSRATGSTVLGIRQSELKKVNILVPPIELQKNLGEILDNLLSKAYYLEKENLQLSKLRELLLSRIISGDIELENYGLG